MQTPLLELKNIHKSFPGVRALDDVNFSCMLGEVHGLVGENGAGKSTLLKIISGVQKADSGQILLRGRKVAIGNPQDALRNGIAMVYQELSLIPDMTVAQNIYLNTSPLRFRTLIDTGLRTKRTVEAIEKYGLKIESNALVRNLSAAQKQFVEIIKVLEHNPDILILDESTSSLATKEVEKLFGIIRNLKADGKAILFITHRFGELFQIADQVTVLKDGRFVTKRAITDVTENSLVELMVGRPLQDIFPLKPKSSGSENVFTVKGLSLEGVLDGISFSVSKGEILGIAGLQGHGQTELLNCLAGVYPKDAGEITLNGRPVRYRSPRQAVKLGITLAPEDRKTLGLCLRLSVRENLALSSLHKRQMLGIVRRKVETLLVQDLIHNLTIKTPEARQTVVNLSGGNQQKVVLGKCLAVKPSVLLFNEPTRGIDVGTKQEFYKIMRRLVQEGIAIIVYSSELLEVIGLCDRVLVMYEGRAVTSLAGDDISEKNIMRYAMGLKSANENEGEKLS
jgi:ABC-type sugar transport system ATPase subunit